MSKRFKTQDHTAYKRLGTRWRKPKGRQSKLRVNKAGSEPNVAIGYGTDALERNRQKGYRVTTVRTASDVDKVPDGNAVIIAGSVGSRQAMIIAARAQGKGLVILNQSKLRRARRIAWILAKKKSEKQKATHPKEKAEQKEKKEKKETEETKDAPEGTEEQKRDRSAPGDGKEQNNGGKKKSA